MLVWPVAWQARPVAAVSVAHLAWCFGMLPWAAWLVKQESGPCVSRLWSSSDGRSLLVWLLRGLGNAWVRLVAVGRGSRVAARGPGIPAGLGLLGCCLSGVDTCQESDRP